MPPTLFRKLRRQEWLTNGAMAGLFAALVVCLFRTFGIKQHVSTGIGMSAAIAGPFLAHALRVAARDAFFATGRKNPDALVSLARRFAATGAAAATSAAFLAEWFRQRPTGSLGEYAMTFAVFLLAGSAMWVPLLVAAGALFGFPIKLWLASAEKGIDATDRGERALAATFALPALPVAVLAIYVAHGKPFADHALILASVLAVGSFLLGTIVAAITTVRCARRRAFLARVSAGTVAGYRVDARENGLVLLRVSAATDAYRSAEVFEEAIVIEESLREHARVE